MSKTVMLGDEQVRLGAFKTFKATEAIGLVGQIFATYPGLIDECEVQQLAAFVVAAYDVLQDQLKDADPQTQAAMNSVRARLPKITLSEPTPAASEPESSPTSAKPSPGRAKNSSTGSRGRTRSTSAENSGDPEKTPSTTP
jgi:hypothetical protein